VSAALRLGRRSSLLMLLASALCLVAFAWPLIAERNGAVAGGDPNLAHQADAPWIFVALLPLLLAIVVAELAEGALDAKCVAVLGVLAACGCALRIPGGIAGFEPVFFLLVLAGRALGYSDARIVAGHILPNILPEILVMGSLWLANAIRTEASLAFVGLGVKPPTATWGGMIREGFENILDSYTLALVPSISILIVIFALNLLGDGLRDAIDPRLKGET